MVTNNLVSTKELIGRLDPSEIEALIADPLARMNPGLARDAVENVQPGAWDTLPDHVKTMILAQLAAQSSSLAREIFDRLQARADDFIDLHELVYGRLSGDNVDRLARLTKRIAHKEFKFIEYSGGIIGLMVGLVQVPVWSISQTWWLLPIVGAAVGLGTNWVAIQMIFRPHERRRVLGVFPYQGLFPKRQGAIAADYGDTAKREILTPETFLAHVTDEGRLALITSIVRGTIRQRLEVEWNKVKAMIPVVITPEMIDRVTDAVLMRLTALIPEVRPVLEGYLDEKLDVGNTVESRLAVLPKPQFERVIRGIFEEDELTLVLVGGFLGAVVGFVQAALVLSI
jgi:uncharacterized membrane protein YheB (UPF0754 family)